MTAVIRFIDKTEYMIGNYKFFDDMTSACQYGIATRNERICVSEASIDSEKALILKCQLIPLHKWMYGIEELQIIADLMKVNWEAVMTRPASQFNYKPISSVRNTIVPEVSPTNEDFAQEQFFRICPHLVLQEITISMENGAIRSYDHYKVYRGVVSFERPSSMWKSMP